MVREASEHAAEDAKRKETIEARNNSEAVLHDLDKNLDEFKDQLDAAEADKVDQAQPQL